ncbi:MAG: hypothetical protein WCJ56_14910 [bacterium]
MRYIIAIILIAISLSNCFAADSAATSSTGISIAYYSITTTATQPLAPATPAIFTLIDNNTATPTPATTWQYRKQGDAAWKAAGTNSPTVTITFTDANGATPYEVQAIRDGIPVTLLVNVAAVLKSKVLFITKAATLTANENDIKTRLEDPAGLNYSVTTAASGPLGTTYPTAGNDLVVTSYESKMGDVGTDLKSVAIPVLTLSFMIAYNMGLGKCDNGNSDTDCMGGKEAWYVQSGVVQANSGLTAGANILLSSGRIIKASTIPAGATIVAYIEAKQLRNIFCWTIAAGGNITDGTAPARRAAFILKDNGPTLSENGWKIFDSLTKYCLGKI